MLLINTGDTKIKWKGKEINVDPKTETCIALSHIGVSILVYAPSKNGLIDDKWNI